MSDDFDFWNKDYTKYGFTIQEAKKIGDDIGVDWNRVDLGQFAQGIKEELEHGEDMGIEPETTNVTGDDLHVTAKIALAHIYEVADYYTRLEHLEKDAEAEWEGKSIQEWVDAQREKNQKIWEEAAAI